MISIIGTVAVRILMAPLLMLMVSCSGLRSTPEPLSVSEGCERLKEVIGEYPDRFASLKKTMKTHYGMHSWRAKLVFPGAKCEIIEWAGGATSYTCLWKRDSQVSAQAVYQKYQPIVERCLGEHWAMNENATKSGEQTVFSRRGQARVSMRYFRNRKSWWTSLGVGDVIKNRKAEVK